MLFTEPSALRYRLVGVGLVIEAKVKPLLMPLNWVWLSTLKASMRNWRCARSLMEKLFWSDRSQLLMPGPVRKLTPDSSPRLPTWGGANAAALIRLYGLSEAVLGL